MTEDVGLQRAILASLHIGPSRPAPPIRAQITSSTGRVDRLFREGIVPQQRKPQQEAINNSTQERRSPHVVNSSRRDGAHNLVSKEVKRSVHTNSRTSNTPRSRTDFTQPPFSHTLHSLFDELPSPQSIPPLQSPRHSPVPPVQPPPHPSPSRLSSSQSSYRHYNQSTHPLPQAHHSSPNRTPVRSSVAPKAHVYTPSLPHHSDPPSHYDAYHPQTLPPPSPYQPHVQPYPLPSSGPPLSPRYHHPPAPLPPLPSESGYWDVTGPASLVCKSASEYQLDSPNKLLSIATLRSAQCVDALSSPNFTVSLQSKLFPTTSHGKVAELVFYLFLQSGNPDETIPFSPKDSYTCVSVNMHKKLVQVEHHHCSRPTTKAPTTLLLDQILLPTLKLSSFFDLKISVKDSCKLDVFVDNSCILSSVDIQTSDIPHRRFGCGLRGQGMATIRNLALDSSHNDPSSAKSSLPPYTGDDKDLVQMIERDILSYSLGVTWDSIAGLTDAKRLLNEAVILPALLPSYFTGIREPWKGVLLYGPPGTGKTMLAKAVASQSNTTFFNISTATLLSKWHGESSRLVRVLFNMARYYAPSTVFLDEIDAVMGSRGATNEHEATRQLKSELLQQIDGICTLGKDGEKKRVTLLAASNFPWLIDEALRRRLKKRIYIPLPDATGRLALLTLQLQSVNLSPDVDLSSLAADHMHGYSAADITMVCRDASMMAMRSLVSGLSPQAIMSLRTEDIDAPVQTRDFLDALAKIKSSVSPGDIQKYIEWTDSFGSS